MDYSANSRLDYLYDLLIENYSTIKEELILLINNPANIENTNKFASLLCKLDAREFINPLLQQISIAHKEDCWLIDYLYAAGNLLEQCSAEESFDIPDTIFDKLKDWLLNNQNELAWNTAVILKHYASEEAEKIQLQKLEQDDFFLTHYECILGLLNYNRPKHIKQVEQIALDENRNRNLRELCESLLRK
ncbi:MAG: hypothetical protein WC716_10480 [Chitinophagaceae bacterium]|jgi:hypothetical protein